MTGLDIDYRETKKGEYWMMVIYFRPENPVKTKKEINDQLKKYLDTRDTLLDLFKE